MRTAKANHLADRLFNHWQLSHFHLGAVFVKPGAVSRRRPSSLLFAYISAEEATLLDVLPHDGQWTRQHLLEILLRTNPAAMERWRYVGAINGSPLTDGQHENLRANGGNAAVVIAGKSFMPALGQTASGHAARLWLYHNHWDRMVDALRHDLEANQVAPHLKPVIFGRLGVPVRLGAYYEHGGMAIIDRNRNGLVLHQMKPLE